MNATKSKKTTASLKAYKSKWYRTNKSKQRLYARAYYLAKKRGISMDDARTLLAQKDLNERGIKTKKLTTSKKSVYFHTTSNISYTRKGVSITIGKTTINVSKDLSVTFTNNQ